MYAELEAKIREYRPKDDLAALQKAFRFASKYHEGQTRDSGEPYMAHPVMVAHILADMRMDVVAMETGLLHDVVEDTSVTVEQVRKEFGHEVARCVDGVTKLTKLDVFSAEDRQAESVRKMLLAMVEDIRVIMVKLADRIHNMRTLGYLSPERRERIARETIEIYAPIAHRLGMGKVRGELEDLAFQHLEPDAYQEILSAIESKRHSNEEFLNEIRQTVESELRREGIPARIDGRVKRPYSVFQKLRRQKISLDQVYDLMALRILTDSVKNCYAALGVIHNKWRPIPGRIKDFIAIPRPNLYQSLHTCVVGPHGQTFEVQIRTEEMHRIAEEGIAAHWKYKEGRKGPAADDQRIAWLRHLVEWQRDVQDPGGVHVHSEGGPVPGRGLHLHAARQGDRAAARRHADRFRLRDSLRCGQHLRGREGQRADCAAALDAAQRRHRRDHDAARPRAEQGLAGVRQDVARAQQDQAPDQRQRAA